MLPKIHLPQYPITIPSTGNKTTYRPFDVGEEKLLLTASESNDREQMDMAIETLIQSCVKDVPDNLKSFDIEYLFTQLRAASVSKDVDLKYRVKNCPLREGKEDTECESEFLLKVNLNQAKVQIEEDGNWCDVNGDTYTLKVDVTDDIGIVLAYPSYKEIKETANFTSTNDIINHLCLSSIDKVWHEDTVTSKGEFTLKEVTEFYESLTPIIKAEIRKFIDNIPVLRYQTTYTCNKCDFSTSIELRGIDDFFG